MTWSQTTSGANESWSLTTSVANESWSLTTSGEAESWSRVTGDAVLTYTALASHTTNENISRFLLVSKTTYGIGPYINLVQAYRSQGAGGRGPGFIWSSSHPVVYQTQGDVTI